MCGLNLTWIDAPSLALRLDHLVIMGCHCRIREPQQSVGIGRAVAGAGKSLTFAVTMIDAPPTIAAAKTCRSSGSGNDSVAMRCA
jgi:hypothetical protein